MKDHGLAAEVAETCRRLAGIESFDERWSTELELGQPWAGRVWCVPPTSELREWARKANYEVRIGRAEVVALLAPAASVETRWWHDSVENERDRPIIRVDHAGWARPAHDILTTHFLEGCVLPVDGALRAAVLLVWRRHP